ncbi:hypothetical protein ANN_01282 [Periplaneta americana]|uniref:CCHC-type domain-containing protein n=1 Tax=Periplaneta americana TaxID=6978 RepID=A0ABQ8TT47_PERAM|nr:hypothetical protein ANN_01282 [Periplaneta americana]
MKGQTRRWREFEEVRREDRTLRHGQVFLSPCGNADRASRAAVVSTEHARASVAYPRKRDSTIVHRSCWRVCSITLCLLLDGAFDVAPNTLYPFQRVLTTTALDLGFSEPTHATFEVRGPPRTNPDYTRDSEWFLWLRGVQTSHLAVIEPLTISRVVQICERRASHLATRMRRFRKTKALVRELDLQAIQLVSEQNAVYLKFTSSSVYKNYLRKHEGSTNIKLQNGEIVAVTITSGDDDMTTVRVFIIPPEVPNDRITNILMNYGKVQSIVNEKWTHNYRFAIDTGIRIVHMSVEKPIPSSLIIANYEAYVTYVGQEETCYQCGSVSHVRSHCPQRIFRQPVTVVPRQKLTFSDILQSRRSTDEIFGNHIENEPHGQTNAPLPTTSTVNKTNDLETLISQQERLSDSHRDIAADCTEVADKIDIHRNTQPNIHDEVTNIQNESETDSVDENDIVLVTENSSIGNEDETPDNKRRKKEHSEQTSKQTKSSSQETRDRLNVISPHGISEIHNPQPMIQDTGAAPSEDEGRIPSSQSDCIQDPRPQTLTATNNNMWSDEMEVVNLNQGNRK